MTVTADLQEQVAALQERQQAVVDAVREQMRAAADGVVLDRQMALGVRVYSPRTAANDRMLMADSHRREARGEGLSAALFLMERGPDAMDPWVEGRQYWREALAAAEERLRQAKDGE